MNDSNKVNKNDRLLDPYGIKSMEEILKGSINKLENGKQETKVQNSQKGEIQNLSGNIQSNQIEQLEQTEPKSEVQQLGDNVKTLHFTIQEFLEYMKHSTDAKSDEATPKGDIESKKYRNYYDVSDTITNATLSNPGDFDSILYDRERVFETLERHAEHVTVSNDSSNTLFVIVSHGGTMGFSGETPIYPGENKTYYNVYEIRLRSPTAGLAYRVTEYPICCASGARTFVASGSTTLASLAASTEAMLVDAIDVSNARVLEIQLTCTFNGAATAGATVNLYASVDGITYDTQNNANTVWVTVINNPVSAGNVRTKTSNPIDVSGLQKLMIHVANQDAAQTLTAITIRYALWK